MVFTLICLSGNMLDMPLPLFPFQGLKSPSKVIGFEETHVDARYPAILFKQQLTASLEKIFGFIRDNLKKEISPLLSLCIQVFYVWSFIVIRKILLIPS